MDQEILLKDAKDTEKLGQNIAKSLKNPALIYLHGELGSGKTTLAQGLIKALVGEKEKVLSPTYAYVQSYAHKPLIYHFDLYRIEDPLQLLELGLDIILADEQYIRLVEWPEQLGHLSQKPDLDIFLLKDGEHRRAIINCF